jgi:hypothetical protein
VLARRACGVARSVGVVGTLGVVDRVFDAAVLEGL